ncbi:MAG: GHKL domain-containing protein [Clostridia bacterium]|nr:GHKL domain-containing protein [Clostridia bacterium]
MKVQKNFLKLESIKTKIDGKDVINFIISIIGIIFSNIQAHEIMTASQTMNVNIMLANIIICAVIISLNIYGLLNKREAVKNERNVKQLTEEKKNLLDVTDNIRCFKHDFNNIIQAIDGYIYLNDMKSLQVYFKSLLKECNHVKVVDFLNCQGLDNPAIYGVLLNKFQIAEENGIKMNIDIMVSLKDLNEKAYVISRMLGILVDNALEATNECADKIVNIQFLKDRKRDKIDIVVENTYANKDVDTCKIFEKNYTTKKDKGNTGLGLWKIQDILKKDNNLELFTTKDETMFKQRIEIYG